MGVSHTMSEEEGPAMPDDLRKELESISGMAPNQVPDWKIPSVEIPTGGERKEEAPERDEMGGSDKVMLPTGTDLSQFQVLKEDPSDPTKYIRAGEAKVVPLRSDVTVDVFDIATPEGKSGYEGVMEKLARGMGTWMLISREKERFMLDPDSERGFRVIVILKYCKVNKVVAVKEERYDKVSESQLKKRFFTAHEPMETVDKEELGTQGEVD